MSAFRKAAFLVFCSAICGALHAPAQEQSVVPVIPAQDENPFFIKDDVGQPVPGATPNPAALSPVTDYPRNKGSEQSAGHMFTTFFTGMFSSVHFASKEDLSGSRLTIEPKSFSLDDRREITATFIVENKTSRLVKLDFPTSQRIELLVRDNNGKVIEKWSDDRAFEDQTGVVMINPGEKIQYEGQIATRDMQPGHTYTIEASMANNPQYTKAVQVTPSAKPSALRPNPSLQPASSGAAKPQPTPIPPLAAPAQSQGY